ncbi:MAG: hypothetical protein VYE53_10485, partial [Planctomycetota bacterium]|nr:hypothetical protein [Planctomycetota bacterium]
MTEIDPLNIDRVREPRGIVQYCPRVQIGRKYLPGSLALSLGDHKQRGGSRNRSRLDRLFDKRNRGQGLVRFIEPRVFEAFDHT